jgi:hypothetical protein
LLPLIAAALFLLWYAKRGRRDPSDRKVERSYHDLQKEDLDFERERMQAFEDSVLGPQISPDS